MMLMLLFVGEPSARARSFPLSGCKTLALPAKPE
jgi:hypothetical protein